MNRHFSFSRRSFCLFSATGLLTCSQSAGAQSQEPQREQILCAGGDELFVWELPAGGGEGKKVWQWKAADAPNLAADRQKWFRNLDEIKPLNGGKQLLVCASNSGCALLERATGKLLWQASARNAHSVEMLPDERVAVASSLGGNQLLLFDLKSAMSEEPIWKTPLPSAHGLVWDEPRQTLWALGFDELRAYKMQNWKSDSPALSLKSTFQLPDEDGHDLRPVPNTDDLLITTAKTVQLFDRRSGKFHAHPLAGELPKVKACDVHPLTGRIVYSTWAKKLGFLHPAAESATSSTVYKCRWLVTDQ